MADAEQDGQEKVINRIMYFGADESFFKNISEKFKETYSSIKVDFENYDSNDSKIIQSYILKIAELKPKLIMIDFSKNEKAMLHLARVWRRRNFYSQIRIIGLCDYTQSKSMVVKAIMTTIPSIHIKSLEYESIVHAMATLAYPDQVKDHGFATAELNDPIHAFHPCKLSLVNENFVRVESNVVMKNKQVLRLNNYWDRQKVTRSNLMMCVDQAQENIYYNYKFSQVLQMAHADPVEQTDDMTQEDFDAKQLRRQETVDESKHKLKKWILDNQLNSRPKFLKAYVVDKTGCFFDNKPLSDSYDFVFRIQPFIANAKREITNIKPQLILYHIESVEKETLEANTDIAHTYNDSRMLQHLIKTVREVCKDRPPIIVLYNSGEHDSTHMQKVLNYPSILAVKEPMTVELSLKMAEMLKKKIAPSLPQPKKGDIYIDKNTDLSYAEIEADITLVGCSENDIFFNSTEPIEDGTLLRVSLPVPMYITVAPVPEYSKLSSQYYGLIHGIGEGERKELRRFINSVFFRGLESDKAQEKQEVESLKKDYLNQQDEDSQGGAEEAGPSEEDLQAQKEQDAEHKAKELIDDLKE